VRTQRPRGEAPRRSSGQAIVEYIIIFPVLLILIMGAIQIALIYQAKFTLNYATFMGARQGALKNANLNSIKDGVAAGLTPLFMRWSGSGTPGLVDLSKARVIATIEVFNPMTADVRIISPTQAAFDALSGGGTEIPNDNLMYRSGDGDGMSIQDANLLKVRVTYCVKLVVPFVNRMIYSLVNGIQGVKNLANEFFWTPATVAAVPATPNMCSTISDLYAGLRQEVNNITSSAGVPGMGTVNSLANSFISMLPTTFPTLPFLNWNIGGLRIPVTAEAIVRMQSPVQSGNLP
jgi:Flp pilus assembly protein TadG